MLNIIYTSKIVRCYKDCEQGPNLNIEGPIESFGEIYSGFTYYIKKKKSAFNNLTLHVAEIQNLKEPKPRSHCGESMLEMT